MSEDKLELMRQMVAQLNQAADAYYDGKAEQMTDYEWDALFDRLKKLEEETGVVLEDSPTMKVSSDHTAGQKEAWLYHLRKQRSQKKLKSGRKENQSGFPGS